MISKKIPVFHFCGLNFINLSIFQKRKKNYSCIFYVNRGKITLMSFSGESNLSVFCPKNGKDAPLEGRNGMKGGFFLPELVYSIYVLMEKMFFPICTLTWRLNNNVFPVWRHVEIGGTGVSKHSETILMLITNNFVFYDTVFIVLQLVKIKKKWVRFERCCLFSFWKGQPWEVKKVNIHH